MAGRGRQVAQSSNSTHDNEAATEPHDRRSSFLEQFIADRERLQAPAHDLAEQIAQVRDQIAALWNRRLDAVDRRRAARDSDRRQNDMLSP